MKTAEITVYTKPVDVEIECPYCRNKFKRSYADFCDEFGEPPDWSYHKICCENCKEEFETFGTDWN